MGLLNFLFGFKGRIGRLAYGLGTSAPLIVGCVLLLVFADFGPGFEQLKGGRLPQIDRSTIMFVVGFVAISVLSCGALGVKRLHDLNSPGWMLLIPISANVIATLLMFVSPAIGVLATVGATVLSFWQMIRLIFFSGAAGDNDYGPPPTVMRDLTGGRVDPVAKEPEWVAAAIRRTSAKAQVAAAATSTPVTRVVRLPKLPPAAAAFGAPNPAGFGRRNR